MKLHTFKIGGVHPAENKIAAGKPIENLPLPEEVVLPEIGRASCRERV